MTVLTGHTSPETAYVVSDYPYGFRLRCQIRVLDRNHETRLACREPDHEPQASGHRLEQAQGIDLHGSARALH